MENQFTQPPIVDTTAVEGHINYFFSFMPDSPLLKYITGLLLILLFILLLRAAARFLQNTAARIIESRKLMSKAWLPVFARNKVFSNLFFWIGLVFLSSISAALLQGIYPKFSAVIIRVLSSLAVLSFVVLLNSLLSVLSDKFSSSFNLPIKGITQAGKIILWILAGLYILSILANKDPMLLIGGLTALSAITMLIFKDSILGLTSGFQLLLNDLVRVGDWIEMPSQGADGDVIDIMLTTVRVQNWDKTIVNIPAYNLVSSSFKNWRGMSESGGRRIKRAINIDIKSIRFLEEKDIKRLGKINLLKDYLSEKEKELKDSNSRFGADVEEYNVRRLSNVGTFRRYCLEYLKQNPNISDRHHCMVRQLAPTSEGLPLEIYAFSNNTKWVDYEGIQSDIFDHLFSIISVFDLKVYQRFGDVYEEK